MLLESLLRDAALSVRLLRGSPSYAAAAIPHLRAGPCDEEATLPSYVPYLQSQHADRARDAGRLDARRSARSAAPARQAIWSIDPNQPVDRVARLPDPIVTSAGDRRFPAVMLGLFAVSGLLLALVGVLQGARYQA